jgi:1-deoxy-D-xylulose-5-phosphate reductoisomerase
MKNVIILGSTGSIGRQTLDVIRENPEDFNVVGLCAGRNEQLLNAQIKEFKPEIAFCLGEIPPGDYKIAQSAEEVAAYENADIVLSAIVGEAGLAPTLAAINAGHDVALANKETLVCDGENVIAQAKKNNVKIIPVDSEHHAIWECMRAGNKNEVKKLILTCSGGAFYGKTREELETVTAREALAHPNWNMGDKITIDSATLMNKALEVIEAHHLFGVDFENIEVILHRQSIMHSAVEFCDGSVVAQLASPDMRLAISNSLYYPDKKPTNIKPLNLAQIGRLTFEKPDFETFRLFDIALTAAKRGDHAAKIMNRANEIAVRKFLDGEIGFLDIEKEVLSAIIKN